MTWEERGIYRELLDECYLKGSIPSGPTEIAALLGEEISIIGHALPRVLACFDKREDRLFNKPIEEIRANQLEARIARANRYQKGTKPDASEHTGAPLDKSTEVDLDKTQSTAQEHSQLRFDADNHTRRGEERRGEDKKKETKEESPKGASSGRRPRKGSVDAFMATDIPKAVIESALRLFAKWDKQDPDGREIKPDFNLMVPRMADILAKHPTLTLEVLEAGAMDYLEYKAKRRKAPQFYFGSQPPEGADKPLWRSYAEAAYMKQKLSQPTAPEPTSEPTYG
jgi:hypothetical protein